jgi:hypothetical protein
MYNINVNVNGDNNRDINNVARSIGNGLVAHTENGT